MVSNIPCHRNATRLALPAIWAGVLSVVCLSVDAACAQDDGRGTLRLDVATGEPLPVGAPGPIPGDIYNHFDASINRRVWAIYEGEGRFSIAMDPGSAQPARRFGFTIAPKEAIELLRQRDPKLAEEVTREGTEVFFKLHSDQRWRLTRTTVPLIYNEQTGERWEFQMGKYRPVSHLEGYSWRRKGDRYTPDYGW
jgi:hypothetical protein